MHKGETNYCCVYIGTPIGYWLSVVFSFANSVTIFQLLVKVISILHAATYKRVGKCKLSKKWQ